MARKSINQNWKEASILCAVSVVHDLSEETGKSTREIMEQFERLDTLKYLNDVGLLVTSMTGSKEDYQWLKDLMTGKVKIDG